MIKDCYLAWSFFSKGFKIHEIRIVRNLEKVKDDWAEGKEMHNPNEALKEIDFKDVQVNEGHQKISLLEHYL